jgi:hypothetical protein
MHGFDPNRGDQDALDMTPEHRAANIQSWAEISEFIEGFPDPSWTDWKLLARRFIQCGLDRHFERHFRAGQSMSTLVFSTLDHHGALHEALVKVFLLPPDTVKLVYQPATPASKGDTRLEYELAFDEAMPTFQRFLNHLWETTLSEPLPSEMRSPKHPFSAPVLTAAEVKAWQGVARH